MKKIILSVLVLLSMFVLSGCGASVTSKTKFDQEGGGTRSITAVISASDAKNLSNGFEELDALLEQAAPEGITIHRTNLTNGDAQYHFSIQFKNIEDYNTKISSITGKSHHATWYSNSNVFQSNVEFKEEDCTYDLIAWALDAFKESKYSAFSNYFKLYEVAKNEFYYNDQLVYSGSSDPSFTVETSPKLLKANVYSDFSYDAQGKKIELMFEQGALERMDLEAARQALEAYSSKVKIDAANDVITYELDNTKEVTDFLRKADMRNQEDCVSYDFVNNPFQRKYTLKETYYLEGFINTFTMDMPVVNYYVKLPEVYEETEFSQAGQQIEGPGQYTNASSLRKEMAYTMETKSNHMVDLKDINISYEVTSDLACKRSIEVSYIKNNCTISQSELASYFPDVTENISFFDAGDTIRLVFVSQQKRDSSMVHGFGFEKLNRENLKFIRHALEEKLDLTRYLPVLEGYEWNLSNIRYNYKVKIEDKAGLYELRAGQREYSLSGDTLGQIKENSGYSITGTDTADHVFTMELCFRQMYHLFYFWIIVIVFIFIVAVLGFTLYYTKKKSPKMEEVLGEEL